MGVPDLRLLSSSDLDFPSELAELTPRLWVRGQVGALRMTPRVTVVGSRAASARGLARARALGQAIGELSGLVISGGALGIDAAAHEGALSVDGHTCAVMGTGVDRSYPALHAPLFSQIARKGCLLSMLELGAPPAKPHFPQRNKLMAALAHMVVIVEAQLNSGTESTARAAKTTGKRVVCFPDSPGTEALARSGAISVGSVAEVLALLGLRDARGSFDDPAGHAPAWSDPACAEAESLDAILPLSSGAVQLAGALGGSPTDLGELCARTGLIAADCAAALIELELRGQCSRLPGGLYIGHSPVS